MNKTSFQPEHDHRRRRSRTEVTELVAASELSGLRRTEYCRQHGLSLTSLKRYSQRRLRFDGLFALVVGQLRQIPQSSHLFLFVTDAGTG